MHEHKSPLWLTHTNFQTRSSTAKAIIFSPGEVYCCSCSNVAVRVCRTGAQLCWVQKHKATCTIDSVLCLQEGLFWPAWCCLGSTHTVTLRFALKQQPFTSAGLVHLLLQLNFANEVDSGSIQNYSARLGTCHFSIAVLSAVQTLIPLEQEMPPAFVPMVGSSAEVFTEACRSKMSSGCKIQNWIPTLNKISVGSFPSSSCSALNLMFPGYYCSFPPKTTFLGQKFAPSFFVWTDSIAF